MTRRRRPSPEHWVWRYARRRQQKVRAREARWMAQLALEEEQLTYTRRTYGKQQTGDATG